MADKQALQARMQELMESNWDIPAIQAGCESHSGYGIPGITPDRSRSLRDRESGFLAGIGARIAAGIIIDSLGTR